MIEQQSYAKKVYELPAYSCTEAGRYLRIPVTTVRAWTKGQPYITKSGEHFFHRVILPADEGTGYLSFGNMIELYVLSSLRKVHNVPLRKVRLALDRIRTIFQTKHPLSDLDLLTDNSDLFIERFGEYLNLSREGQIEMKSELEECVRHIEKDAYGIPRKLFPRKGLTGILIDPLLNFGRPSIAGAGIPTEILFERFKSGEDLDFLAADYRCDKTLIQQAIEYEGSAREAA